MGIENDQPSVESIKEAELVMKQIDTAATASLHLGDTSRKIVSEYFLHIGQQLAEMTDIQASEKLAEIEE